MMKLYPVMDDISCIRLDATGYLSRTPLFTQLSSIVILLVFIITCESFNGFYQFSSYIVFLYTDENYFTSTLAYSTLKSADTMSISKSS